MAAYHLSLKNDIKPKGTKISARKDTLTTYCAKDRRKPI